MNNKIFPITVVLAFILMAGIAQGAEPAITITTPTNTTYARTTIYLNATSNETTDWMAFELNGAANDTTIYDTETSGESTDGLLIISTQWVAVQINFTQPGTLHNFSIYLKNTSTGNNKPITVTIINDSNDNLPNGSVIEELANQTIPFNVKTWVNYNPTDFDFAVGERYWIVVWTLETGAPTYTWYQVGSGSNYPEETWLGTYRVASTDQNISWVTYNYAGLSPSSDYLTLKVNASVKEFNNVIITAAEGNNELIVFANDTSGNMNYTKVIFFVDSTPPHFSSYDINATPNEDQDINISVIITDSSSIVDTVFIEVTNNTDTINYTVNINITTEWEFILRRTNFTAHDNITWYWYANDTGGNLNRSAQQEFIVVNRAPAAPTLGIPANNSNLSTASITFNWTLSTDNDAEDTFTYYLLINGTMNLSNANITNWTAVSFVDGSYFWNIYADDNYTNTSSLYRNFTVDTVYPHFSGYKTNTTPNEDQDIVLNVTLTEDYLDTITLELKNNTHTINYTPISIGSEHYLVIDQNNYTAHDNITWYWYANDTAGNLNSSSQQEFIVANQAPSAPALGVPANNTNSSSSLVTFNWSLSTDLDAEDTFTYYLLINGTMNLSNANITNWTAVSFVDGEYYWYVYADDNYTNTSSLQRNFVVDTVKPSIDIDYPVNGQHYGNATRELNFTVTDAYPQTYILEYFNASNSTQALNFTWFNGSNITFSPVLNANQTATLYINDTAGNLNHSSISFVSDITAPTMSDATQTTCVEFNQIMVYSWTQSDNLAGTFKESYCNWTSPSSKTYKISSSSVSVNATATCQLSLNESGTWNFKLYVEDEVLNGEGFEFNTYTWGGSPTPYTVTALTGNYFLTNVNFDVLSAGECGGAGDGGGGGGSPISPPEIINITCPIGYFANLTTMGCQIIVTPVEELPAFILQEWLTAPRLGIFSVLQLLLILAATGFAYGYTDKFKKFDERQVLAMAAVVLFIAMITWSAFSPEMLTDMSASLQGTLADLATLGGG